MQEVTVIDFPFGLGESGGVSSSASAWQECSTVMHLDWDC